jgi:peptide/nickel transport system permease protein
VLAARLAGKGRLRIAFEHVLPNLSGTLIVQATIQLALAIAAEAGLSYVGLGAQPPAASWGRMLSEAQTLAAVAPWLVWFPGLALCLTVLAFGVLGERLRARLDPRSRS